MADKQKQPDKAKQTTGKGLEIPVPKRGDFYRDLEKASDAKPSRPRRRRKKDH